MKEIIITLTAIITPIVLFFTFFNHIINFSRNIFELISKKIKYKKIILNLILDWYNYIDKNIDNDDFNISIVNNLENEISHQFSLKSNKKLLLYFNKNFRKKIMKELFGYKKYPKSDAIYKKYFRLDDDSTSLALQLTSGANKKNYSIYKFPFEFYWNLIRGNYYNFIK